MVWSFSSWAEVSDKVWPRDNKDEEDNTFTASTTLGKDNIDL